MDYIGCFIRYYNFLVGGGFAYANYLLDSTLEQVVTKEVIIKEEAEIAETVIEKEEES